MTSGSSSELSAASASGGRELRLPRPPGVIRRFWARHPRVTDSLLALIWGFLAIGGTFNASSSSPWAVGAAIALVVVAVAGIFVRRTHPLLAVALSGAAIVASIWSPDDIVLAPAVFAVYSVAAQWSVRAGWLAAGLVEVASVIAAAIGEYLPGAGTSVNPFNPAREVGQFQPLTVLSFAIQFGLVLALAVALGVNVGNRRRYLAALIDRARQLAVERDQQAELATAAERGRIAREMHDIVSHSLTLMVALSEGSAVAADAKAPEAAAAMRKAAETGRAAMVDMRRMLGVLGGDTGAETAPQPGIRDLAELIEQFRSLGVPVASRLDGPPPSDPTVQLALYRLVQEALTNVLRYAKGPSTVTVVVAATPDAVTATVTDDGLAGFPPDPRGAGRGLLGLRERVTALGGEFSAGPAAGGRGWRVQATLPLPDHEGIRP